MSHEEVDRPVDEVLYEDTWKVLRHGRMERLVDADGQLSWRVTVWDEGRDPFLIRYFYTPHAAYDFYQKLMGASTATVKVHR